MGILDKIKQDVKRSGNNKSKFMYFREGEKRRVRFLDDMEDGMEVVMHDSFEQGINVPCRELYGEECQYCEDETLRTRSNYIWSVWDYDANEVKLIMQAVSRCSPIPALMAMYENYGTLCDRDYVITSSGRGVAKTFSVIPMDKQKFRNQKAKPYTHKQILTMLDKAFPDDNADSDDDEYEKPVKKSKKPAKHVEEPEDDSWDDDEQGENDYESMSAKELWKLCKDREIDCQPKKQKQYYINLLEEADKAEDDWGDGEDDYDDDEWEDE